MSRKPTPARPNTETDDHRLLAQNQQQPGKPGSTYQAQSQPDGAASRDHAGTNHQAMAARMAGTDWMKKMRLLTLYAPYRPATITQPSMKLTSIGR